MKHIYTNCVSLADRSIDRLRSERNQSTICLGSVMVAHLTCTQVDGVQILLSPNGRMAEW